MRCLNEKPFIGSPAGGVSVGGNNNTGREVFLQAICKSES